MRRFRAIVQTNKEPEDINILWYSKGILKYFDAGEWKPLNVVHPEDISITIEALPNIKNLKEALDYLFEKTNNYRIVDTYKELESLKNGKINNGTHCYVTDIKRSYIYSTELNEWVLEDVPQQFYLFTDHSIVTDFNSKTGYIEFKDTIHADTVAYIAFGDAATVSDLSICRLEKEGEDWYLKDTNKNTPKKGDFIYIVAIDRDSKEVLVLEIDFDGEVSQSKVLCYNNTIDSIFEDSLNIIEAIVVNTDNINTLFTWKRITDRDQLVQDTKIEENKNYARELNEKIDAKVIEAGGVAFDLEPTKDSNNAVFSGGVHKYIEDKFVVLTPEEYESLVIKNSNTFYFILDDSN